ncbi:MAG: Mth938-like domain-containing protein [Methyloligellaceae bacterium]|nr:MAG: hypothetical protein D6773_05215 [Alphaproteobacteria bacterium]
MSEVERFFAGTAPIDAYGNGGFRFAEMSHRGSLLMLPWGIFAWDISSAAALNPDAFARVLTRASEIDFLLLGTGERQVMPPAQIWQAFEKADVGLEVMDTGAACRTYNVILGEGRAAGAALIAVE